MEVSYTYEKDKYTVTINGVTRICDTMDEAMYYINKAEKEENDNGNDVSRPDM